MFSPQSSSRQLYSAHYFQAAQRKDGSRQNPRGVPCPWRDISGRIHSPLISTHTPKLSLIRVTTHLKSTGEIFLHLKVVLRFNLFTSRCCKAKIKPKDIRQECSLHFVRLLFPFIPPEEILSSPLSRAWGCWSYMKKHKGDNKHNSKWILEMIFILHWTETKTFQNIHRKQKMFVLEEQTQSFRVDTMPPISSLSLPKDLYM